MATSTTTDQSQCSICNKRSVTICQGCSQMFCFKDYSNHRQFISKGLDEIENDRDQFRQTFDEQKKDSNNSVLIKQINQWEETSIKKIQETAKDCRQLVMEHVNQYDVEIEKKLIILTDEIRTIRHEDEFTEIDINRLKTKLTDLSRKLSQPQDFSIKEVNEVLVKKISLVQFSSSSSFISISENARWEQNGVTIAGGHGEGRANNQLNRPFGISVDEDRSVFIADTSNHRIMQWKLGATSGEIVVGGNGKGNQTDQLNLPFDVTVDKMTNSIIICDKGNRRVMRWSLESDTKNGEILIEDIDCERLTIDDMKFFYISDIRRHEVRRYGMEEKNGIVVAGGNGRGDRLNQLNWPSSIFVDGDYSVYVADRDNHRVMKWVKGATEGILVAGGKGHGNLLSQLSLPQGLFVDSFGTVYVTEVGNERVTRWRKGAKEGEVVVGGNGTGGREDQFHGPVGLSLDRQGYLYVANYYNHRVQRFSIQSN